MDAHDVRAADPVHLGGSSAASRIAWADDEAGVVAVKPSGRGRGTITRKRAVVSATLVAAAVVAAVVYAWDGTSAPEDPTIVRGRVEVVMEDHFDGDSPEDWSHHSYTVVRPDDGHDVYVNNPAAGFPYMTGDRVTLRVEPDPEGGDGYDLAPEQETALNIVEVIDVDDASGWAASQSPDTTLHGDDARHARRSLTAAHGRRLDHGTTGTKSMLVMAVSFSDGPAACDVNCVEGSMWGSGAYPQHVAGMFAETSYGAITFPQGSGAARAVTIGSSSTYTSCNYNLLADDADAAVLSQHGVDVTNYDFTAYIFPSSPSVGCGWSGIGELHGPRSWTKSGGTTPYITFAHEVGHNLGTHHASTDGDNDGSINSEYGDSSCIMGSGAGWRTMNGPHRWEMEWIPHTAANVGTRATTAGVSSWEVAELSDSPSNNGNRVSIVQQPRTYDHNNLPDSHYYFSYRTAPAGSYDATLSASHVDKVAVHHLKQPGWRTMLVTQLGPGQSFSDSNEGLSVTFQSAGDDGTTKYANLDVEYACTPNAVTVRTSPSFFNCQAAGDTINVGFVVDNNDPFACADSTFSVTYQTPSPDWVVAWAYPGYESPQVIPPRGQASFVVDITVPQSAVDPNQGTNWDIDFFVTSDSATAGALHDESDKTTIRVHIDPTANTVRATSLGICSTVTGTAVVQMRLFDA